MVVSHLRALGEAMMTRARRSRVLLLAGAVAGLAVAMHGMLSPRESALPPGVVAMVGDVPITAEEYARTLAAVASDRRDGALDRALQRHVLDRLVDEELLVQAAIASGLPLREPALRGQLASAMIDAIVGVRAEPSDEALRAHFAGRSGAFARNGRVRVEAHWFEKGDARARAATARIRMLRGEVVANADTPPVGAPTALVPHVKLADYMGANVASAVASLAVLGVTPPIEVGSGVWLVRVLERRDGVVPPFEAVRAEVLADYRREQDDLALRAWLARRRIETRVAVREPLP